MTSGSSIPPVLAVAHTIAVWTPMSVLIGLGVGRLVIESPDGQRVPATMQIEWASALSMAPQTALILRNQLNEFVEAYEAKLGPIPFDRSLEPPNGSPNVIAMRYVPPKDEHGFTEEMYRTRVDAPYQSFEPPAQPPSDEPPSSSPPIDPLPDPAV